MKLDRIDYLRLLDMGRDDEGWADVSKELYPVISHIMPVGLVELDDENSRARLTPDGREVLRKFPSNKREMP